MKRIIELDVISISTKGKEKLERLERLKKEKNEKLIEDYNNGKFDKYFNF